MKLVVALLLLPFSSIPLVFAHQQETVGVQETVLQPQLRGGGGRREASTGEEFGHGSHTITTSRSRKTKHNDSRKLKADQYIFNDISDGYAQGTGSKVGTPCRTNSKVSFIENGDQDYMNIATTKWHSGGYRMGCIERGENWSCLTACNTYPNFGDWSHLTFEAKVSRTTADCKPAISLTKKWPMYRSNTLELEGSIVDGGQLRENQWTRVVIPIANFVTEEWTDINGVKDITFVNGPCAPHYQVSGLLLTDSPPSIEEIIDTPIPTPTPSIFQSVWNNIEDSYAFNNQLYSCFEQKDRTSINVIEESDYDYFTVSPDKWVSGGLRFGCVHKDENWICDAPCFPFDGSSPNWSNKLYLTFMAKVEGDLTATCKASVSLTGGGWPRLNSNTINLEENYVDSGYLVSDEWRRVLIPLEDFKTADWSLTAVYGLYFRTCGTAHSGMQPKYYIREIAVTNTKIELNSVPPSQTPTEYVTDDPLLATHRFVHTNYYPLLGADREPEGHSWIVAANNNWPEIPSNSSPHTVTVFIPKGQMVMYSGYSNIKLDKLVIEGSLTIQPYNNDVLMNVGSIVIEDGGALDIKTTNASPYKITIEIEGALDTSIDPEEQMVGIIALNGNLTVAGNDVSTKMAPLQETAQGGSQSLILNGVSLQFVVGGELVLPDTQKGLNIGHWNFPHNTNYVDQTEICKILSIEESSGKTLITCEDKLAFDHSSGSTAAYVTRSINIMTSSQSTDRGHMLHTGTGKFEVRNCRLENFGRTTTDMIDSTVMTPTDLKFGEGIVQMNVTKLGSNQIARYALHAHHSLVEAYFTGNAVLYSPRDGMVAHNSRVHILDNIIVGAEGTGIFLEDSTETGPVMRNYIIGNGKGTRGGDDGRFSSQKGLDMAHGGFGIWLRGKLALVQDNHCEGHFGVAPYAFFVHPNFISDKRVPNVKGTPSELIGKTSAEISKSLGSEGLELQSFGGFVNNTAVATFQVGIDLSYFGTKTGSDGSIIEGARITNLALNGRGISTIHSTVFTLNHVTIEGVVEDNTITGIWCNSCNGCQLRTPNTTLVIENVNVARGGNC